MIRRPSLVLPSAFARDGRPDALRDLLDLAAEVDRTGAWEALAVPDSVLALPFHDSTVVLGALAARTDDVRLGWAALASLALRHPVVLARQWMTLDHLSGGRTFLAVAPGNRTGTHHVREREVFGMGFDERLDRTLDGVRFLRAVRDGGPVTHVSPWLDVRGLDLAPGLVQRRAPVWMTANPSAGASDSGVVRLLRRVAELGDGWLTHSTPPDVLARRAAILRGLRAEAGSENGSVSGSGSEADEHASLRVVVHVNLFLDLDDARARREAEPAWRAQAARGLTWPDALACGAIGSPERAADLVHRLHDAGATDVLLNPLGPDPRAQVLRATEHLLPQLPAAPGSPSPAASAVTHPTPTRPLDQEVPA